MASRTDIVHPALGHLEYDEQLDWYSAKVSVDGQVADLSVHCDGATGEPPALPHAVRIAGKLELLCGAAKECAVRDLLELRNGTWRDEDEPMVDADEFKRLMEPRGSSSMETGAPRSTTWTATYSGATASSSRWTRASRSTTLTSRARAAPATAHTRPHTPTPPDTARQP